MYNNHRENHGFKCLTQLKYNSLLWKIFKRGYFSQITQTFLSRYTLVI